MAEVRYPKIPKAVWWSLRRKFASTLPSIVTPSYLATLLGYKEVSAKETLIPQLRLVGLIDDEGKPTDRANDWRTDAKYAAVCQAIRHDIYPRELLDLFPDAHNRSGIVDWFKMTGKMGESNAGQCAAFYILITDGKVAQADEKPQKTKNGEPTSRKARTAPQTTKPASVTSAAAQVAATATSEAPVHHHRQANGPSVHINLQIHISPEASTDQVNAIFKGIAEHLYSK
jgi:hypothetical protein